ncbi:rhomboid family intramembrane serine protease [Atopomonas sediminilitoris]|uniref:rhomboid family intramembrane serine protease n=1 Tax=Atopomonas sediminilitoris TaxID=2919919 RepID=UPI001F4D7F9E|nr:rhomboid family intramembrane serine protease [Atopomonas sediminilitoris]
MKPVIALRCPLDEDLSVFVAQLQRAGVPCRVAEESGEQVLWVPPAIAEGVQQLYQQGPAAWAAVAAQVSAPGSHSPSEQAPALLQRLRVCWLSATVLALSCVVALVSGLGQRLEVVAWLSLQAFSVHGEYLQVQSLADTLASGQWWRVVTPALLHFSVLHIVFNSLWLWELGQRIELRQGRLLYGLLLLITALAANLAQYAFNASPLFGGLSGVVYGLLGFCWLYQWRLPCAHYALPKALVGLMLGWLLVCASGVLEQFDLYVANAAHVGGLLAGCALGLLVAEWDKRRLASH